ncbi:hypothetical protein B0J18DRAFT_488534 [Chaetomium sp. MPI-SDFR-AT-0129]|nr:hypothetical protein B0J18DRAFT_488534 [Chaetomium sp. MPI-SDFR-AT-0129]
MADVLDKFEKSTRKLALERAEEEYDQEPSDKEATLHKMSMLVQLTYLNQRYRAQGAHFALLGWNHRDIRSYHQPKSCKHLFLFRCHEQGHWNAIVLRSEGPSWVFDGNYDDNRLSRIDSIKQSALQHYSRVKRTIDDTVVPEVRITPLVCGRSHLSGAVGALAWAEAMWREWMIMRPMSGRYWFPMGEQENENTTLCKNGPVAWNQVLVRRAMLLKTKRAASAHS